MVEFVEAIVKLLLAITVENFPYLVFMALFGGCIWVGLRLAKSMDRLAESNSALSSSVVASCTKIDTIVEFITASEGKDGQRRDFKHGLLAPAPVVE